MENNVNSDFFSNIILSETECLPMKPKMKLFEHNRNKSCIVYGSSGSGKTFSIVKPNLLQRHGSYVVTTANSDLLSETVNLVVEKDYKTKVLKRCLNDILLPEEE